MDSLDITISRQTAVRGFRWRFTASGQPYDLTGWAARLQVRPGRTADEAAGGTPVVTLATGGSGLTAGLVSGKYGYVEMELTVAQSNLFTARGDYWYDLILTPPAGSEPVERTESARWFVAPAVTAPA